MLNSGDQYVVALFDIYISNKTIFKPYPLGRFFSFWQQNVFKSHLGANDVDFLRAEIKYEIMHPRVSNVQFRFV